MYSYWTMYIGTYLQYKISLRLFSFPVIFVPFKHQILYATFYTPNFIRHILYTTFYTTHFIHHILYTTFYTPHFILHIYTPHFIHHISYTTFYYKIFYTPHFITTPFIHHLLLQHLLYTTFWLKLDVFHQGNNFLYTKKSHWVLWIQVHIYRQPKNMHPYSQVSLGFFCIQEWGDLVEIPENYSKMHTF